jgi:protein-S-isoprenylcysteine O-methyltransferase Ste14
VSIPGDFVAAATAGRPACTSSKRTIDRKGHWIFGRVIPAASILALMTWQMIALAHDGRILIHDPSGTVIVGCIRGSLYAFFLSIPVAAFLFHNPPVARDGRLFVHVAALVATFLLIVLGLFAPSGPLLLSVSAKADAAALVLTVVGVAFATAAMVSLGMNFSFWPEAREVVSRGPYRLVRHPVYLAEIVMSSAVLVSNLRLTLVLGECLVIVLQLVRIRAEEHLLAGALPAFSDFKAMTPHRLIPGLW